MSDATYISLIGGPKREQVIFRPRIYKYDTFKEFAQEKKLSDSDLFIVAGEFIYDLYLAPAGISREMVISQEKYGVGEPSDVMVDESMLVEIYTSLL